jgi:hypothetical protein
MTFDAVTLNRVLIEFVDQQVMRMALAQCEQRANIFVEVGRIAYDIRGLRQFGADFWRLSPRLAARAPTPEA